MVLLLLLLLITVLQVIVGEPTTTTNTYEIEIPGANPIRIVEGEPLWHSRFEHRAFNPEAGEDPLHQFLANYAENIYRNRDKQKLDNIKENSEQTKSWDLVQYPKRNTPPFDEKKGWVTLEPVPWSVSKISKWESKYKPNSKPFDEYEPQESQPSHWNRPGNNYDSYFSNKNEIKPTPPVAVYNQKVHVDYSGNKHQHKHDNNCQHNPNGYNEHFDRKNIYKPGNIYESNEEEIITDGRPSDFPHLYEANRRRATDIHPDNHPFSGEGEWVLLSTTKGYKHSPNHKQRSLEINPESIGTHRSVRLTVLPPLKDSKINMTTSHGGLLQVESTFQTVEQSRKMFNKKQKTKRKSQQKKKKKPVRQQALQPTTLTTTKKSSAPDSSAVLAAVGAGMIPATMAMLVPMAMGGRRKRDTTVTVPVSIGLIRNM